VATKRIIRTPNVPDSWDKVWPFGQKSPEFMEAVTRKIAAAKEAEVERQREYIRDQARQRRRT
jgi:hypothetical protein